MKKIDRGASFGKSSADSLSYAPYLGGVKASTSLDHSHRLSFYDVAPSHDISLDELEQLALHRLHVLKAVETASVRQLKEEDFSGKLKLIEDKYLPLHSNATANTYPLDQERQNDLTSHFILRLGFCMREDTRRWFTAHECLLFRHRFSNATSEEKLFFIQDHLPQLQLVSEEEKNQWRKGLLSCIGAGSSLSDIYYKVPFELVGDLIMKRSVFLHKGWAYVPRIESFSILLNIFKSHLEFQLEETAKSVPRLNEEERLLPILLNICKSSENIHDPVSIGIQNASKLSHSDIEKVTAHFPPCMTHLHSKLKEEAHLKYGGRMQYGLFLKSIGLTLEEAILFWKKTFSRKTTEDVFQKNYLYNIRHNYGQEGKRANYAPYSCHKIITSNPPYGGDHHGCPFRHFGTDQLLSFLSNLSAPTTSSSSTSSTVFSSAFSSLKEKALSAAEVREIMDLVQGHHYQIACTRLFELSRKSSIASNKSSSSNHLSSLETISYPHQFFEWSYALGGAPPQPIPDHKV